MGRDYSVPCPRGCGAHIGGINGPDRCPCEPHEEGDVYLSQGNYDAYRKELSSANPGAAWMWNEERIATIEADLVDLHAEVAKLKRRGKR